MKKTLAAISLGETPRRGAGDRHGPEGRSSLAVRLCALALASAFLCVNLSAEARLIRNGGRATVSNNSAVFVLLADNALISGSNLILPSGSRPDSDPNANPATMESGSERIYTVPNDCFTFVGSFEAQEAFNAANEDCRYEFFEGESLEFFGFMDHFLPGAATVDVFWTLTGTGGNPFSFEFPGGLTAFDTTSDFTSTTAALSLLVDPLPGLTPGEYEISARSRQTAPEGFTFFEYPFVNPTVCDVPINGPDEPSVCIIGGTVLGDSYSNISLPTRVTILPASVPEPSSLVLLLLAGLGGLVTRVAGQQRRRFRLFLR